MMFLAGSGCNAQAGGGLTFVTALALSSIWQIWRISFCLGLSLLRFRSDCLVELLYHIINQNCSVLLTSLLLRRCFGGNVFWSCCISGVSEVLLIVLSSIDNSIAKRRLKVIEINIVANNITVTKIRAHILCHVHPLSVAKTRLCPGCPRKFPACLLKSIDSLNVISRNVLIHQDISVRRFSG